MLNNQLGEFYDQMAVRSVLHDIKRQYLFWYLCGMSARPLFSDLSLLCNIQTLSDKILESANIMD